MGGGGKLWGESKALAGGEAEANRSEKTLHAFKHGHSGLKVQCALCTGKTHSWLQLGSF